ncbi:MAG: S-layer homology domain-containing protein [Pseudoflavonifractor sp.]|nr:S-layer homology domain-containing protein [Pseudoflavonifractor sp.]
MKKRFLCLVLALLLASPPLPAAALSGNLVSADATAAYVVRTVPSPTVSSTGGDWAVLGIVRSGYAPDEGWLNTYYSNLTAALKRTGGKLTASKYSEYSRAILVLTAAGYDPSDVEGYDLTAFLSDYEGTVKQGINGAIWALIALDCGNYPSSLREDYIRFILSRQLTDGGFALGTDRSADSDPDITAMALVALSNYFEEPEVAAAVEKAVLRLSALQCANGGYESGRAANSESCAQVLIALCTLGISSNDARFVKNGSSVCDALMDYALEDGAFEHSKNGGESGMATEQALLALDALSLYTQGRKLFCTFRDVRAHEAQGQIEALAALKMIGGKGNGSFAPDETMTRSQFCSIIVKALGLKPEYTDQFRDVDENAWYAGHVGAAYAKGIIRGASDTEFKPEDTITILEAEIMVSRAARTMGLGGEEPVWSPDTKQITRGEVAAMVYELIERAGVL